MRPEEYRNIIKSLEGRYMEFIHNSQGSNMFGEEDRRLIEQQYTGAQTHYDNLVIQLPIYSKSRQPHHVDEVMHCSLQKDPVSFVLQGRTRL